MTPSLGIRYLGGPTALVDIAGLRLLTDPTFDPAGPHPVDSRVLVKTSDPVATAEQVGPVRHIDTDGPTAVGTKCLTTRRIGFAERAVTSEVTHIDPPRAWGVHASTVPSGRSST